MSRRLRLVLLAASLLAASSCTDLGDEAGDPTGGVDRSYLQDVAPILQSNCAVCHVSGHVSGLDLGSWASLMSGGQSGPAVVPGDADASLLVSRITTFDPNDRMPPGARLGDAQIAAIRAWIDEGAGDN